MMETVSTSETSICFNETTYSVSSSFSDYYMVFKNASASAWKKIKDTVTVLLICSMTSTIKMKPLIMGSAVFLKKIGSGMHSDTKFGPGGIILMPGKKVLERRSGLCPSEKELLEQHSGMSHHKNTPNRIG
jgi:hypothetical protein